MVTVTVRGNNSSNNDNNNNSGSNQSNSSNSGKSNNDSRHDSNNGGTITSPTLIKQRGVGLPNTHPKRSRHASIFPVGVTLLIW